MSAAALPPTDLQHRIRALRLPRGANDQIRAMFSNLRRHGARMPAAQAEKLIALIEQAGRPNAAIQSIASNQLPPRST